MKKNKSRIPMIMLNIEHLWLNEPDLTLMQLLQKILNKSNNPIDDATQFSAIDDDILSNVIRKYQRIVFFEKMEKSKPLEYLNENQELRIAFNKTLISIEQEIYLEAIKLDKELLNRVNDSNEPRADYEMRCIITFWLSEADTEYEDNHDNILFELDINLKNIFNESKVSDYFGIFDNNNHNLHSPTSLIEPYCYLMHDIKEHKRVSDKDLKRVDMITTDIKVEYQFERKIEFKKNLYSNKSLNMKRNKIKQIVKKLLDWLIEKYILPFIIKENNKTAKYIDLSNKIRNKRKVKNEK